MGDQQHANALAVDDSGDERSLLEEVLTTGAAAAREAGAGAHNAVSRRQGPMPRRPRPKPPSTAKAWKQKVRRGALVATDTQRELACVHRRHQDRVQALRSATDGVLWTKTEDERRRPHLTFKTAMRIACAPTHLGLPTLQSALFGNGVAASSVRRARLRVAASLRCLHNAMLSRSMSMWGGGPYQWYVFAY